MDQQPRLTDLVPLRLVVHLIPLTLGAGIIAGLEALYAWSPQWASLTSDGHIAAFDLDCEGSLGSWFSSTILLLSGLAAILVYLIRRHRIDDYQGYYRVWLWAATCCFLMSIDEGSSLHEGFKELMAYVTGTRLWGDGSVWWVVPYGFLLGAVGTRLLLDMRQCWLSSAAFVGAGACFTTAVLAQLGWILPDAGAREVMLEEGAEMLGDVLLLVAIGLHARFVILQASGVLPQRRPEDDVEENGLEERQDPEAINQQLDAAMAGSVIVHPPHGVPRPVTSSVVASRPASAPAVGTVAPSSALASTAQRTLTKAERKALRKRLAQLRAAREERLGG